MTERSHNPEKDRYYLDWPEEQVGEDTRYFRWLQPGSNICLDFHGDPVKAQLVVFSDGNLVRPVDQDIGSHQYRVTEQRHRHPFVRVTRAAVFGPAA